MWLTAYKKTWIIGIIIFYLSLSIFSTFFDYQNIQHNNDDIFRYLVATNINNPPIIFKEQHSNYLAFFIKPLKLFVTLPKYFHLTDFKTTYLRFIYTQNIYIAIIVITIFAIYYQLSRTSSEKPDLLI